MAQITLNANEQTASKTLVQATEREQSRVTVKNTALTEATTKRDDCLEEMRVLLVELGHAPPNPLTEAYPERDSTGAWTGKLYLNEVLP